MTAHPKLTDALQRLPGLPANVRLIDIRVSQWSVHLYWVRISDSGELSLTHTKASKHSTHLSTVRVA